MFGGQANLMKIEGTGAVLMSKLKGNGETFNKYEQSDVAHRQVGRLMPSLRNRLRSVSGFRPS